MNRRPRKCFEATWVISRELNFSDVGFARDRLTDLRREDSRFDFDSQVEKVPSYLVEAFQSVTVEILS
jgi:hypothetical protein